mmetsp:Transcript_3895/g.8394  ORF Transcript_3895/g.8394 Transcript_3895/m.8394 type:complete len:381 (+) Transcript_3895:957-2099(+)
MFNVGKNPFVGSFIDDGSQFSRSASGLDFRGRGNNLLHQCRSDRLFVGSIIVTAVVFVDRQEHRGRHAPLPRTTGKTHGNVGRGPIDVAILQRHQVVLGTPQCRAPFGISIVQRWTSTAPGNNFGHGRRTNKGDGAHIGVIHQSLDANPGPLDHVEDPVRQPRFLEEFGRVLHGQGDLLARFENDRVSHDQGNRNRPHGHHKGEIKGDDRNDNPQRIPAVRAVYLAGDSERVSDRQLRQGAGPFDRLVALCDIGQGLGDVLAVFLDNELGQLPGVFLDQCVEFHHDRCPLFDGSGRPGAKGVLGGFDGRVDVAGRRECHLSDRLGICGIDDVHVIAGGRRDKSTGNVIIDDDGGGDGDGGGATTGGFGHDRIGLDWIGLN